MPFLDRYTSLRKLRQRLKGSNNGTTSSGPSRQAATSQFAQHDTSTRGDAVDFESQKQVKLRGFETSESRHPSQPSLENSASMGIDIGMFPPSSTDTVLGVDMSVPQINLPHQGAEPLQTLVNEGITRAIDAGPKATKTERVLNRIGDTVDTATETQGVISKVIEPMKTALEATQAIKAIESGLQSFAEDIPWLMKGLDEVARIHPVVTVAVLAFKAVYSMEMTRRENDKRIRALYVEMRDMIAVLVQLKDVRDPKDEGPDGKTIEARLQGLAQQTADDIRDCANACDTYAKKRLLVKVVKGPSWAANLVAFVEIFTKRRTEFEQALSIHIARSLDAMHSTVHFMKSTVESIDKKLDLFTQIFQGFVSTDEASMLQKVKEKGGLQVIQRDDNALLELDEFEGSLSPQSFNNRSQVPKQVTLVLKDLREELREDFDVSIAKNLDTFQGKFVLYQRQLKEELSRFIHEENNRILLAVREGPHDRIRDRELREIWKEMHWRLNVKARLFVLTLREHLRDRVHDPRVLSPRWGFEEMVDTPGTDDWAFQFINSAYLQQIMEAFDDDGSGYITITEINRFMDAKPTTPNWSLQHWLAYWAIGWQISSHLYCEKIFRVLSAMFSLLPNLLPENRHGADFYLRQVWPGLTELTFGASEASPELDKLSRFQDYIDGEEIRLKENLRDIKYSIDALDTVYAVAGPGRIEKSLLPLLYLLLQKDLQIFQLGKTKAIPQTELRSAVRSLSNVLQAAALRLRDLVDMYRQQRVDLDKQFSATANGLYKYVYNNAKLFGRRVNQDPNSFDTTSSMSTQAPQKNNDFLIDDLFVSTEAVPWPYACDRYDRVKDTLTPLDLTADLPLREIVGEWVGHVYQDNEYPLYTLWTFYFHAVQEGDQESFNAKGIDFGNEAYNLSGKCSQNSDGVISTKFIITYLGGSPTEYYSAHIDESNSLVGTFSMEENVIDPSHKFIFRKVSPDIMCRRPSLLDFAENKAKALWKFAKSAVLDDVRKKMWSWSYFSERRRTRKRYIDLNIRWWTYGRPLDEHERAEYLDIRLHLTPEDSDFWCSIRDYQLQVIPDHLVICAGCKESIGGARVICLDCVSLAETAQLSDAVDFCDNPFCWETTVTHSFKPWVIQFGNPHLSNHGLMKIRTVLHTKDVLKCENEGRGALGHARSIFKAKREEVIKPSEPSRDIHPEGRDSELEQADGIDPPSSAENIPEVVSKDARGPCCSVCMVILVQPCWYCVTCKDGDEFFVCDACESQALLPCVLCQRPFTQPSWYYGNNPDDIFTCNTCAVKGLKPGDDVNLKVHSYTHPLVRVTENEPEVPTEVPPPQTTETQLAVLEQRVAKIDERLHEVANHVLGGGSNLPLSDRLTRIEQTLNLIISKLDSIETTR